MKALSLTPDWALLVALEEKTIECRTWKTDYRGDILICSSARKYNGTIGGHALCKATLEDIVPFTEDHLALAAMEEDEMPEGKAFAWILSDISLIKPFPVKGKLHLFDVDDELITVPEGLFYEEVLEKYYLPLVYFEKDDREMHQMWKELTYYEGKND